MYYVYELIDPTTNLPFYVGKGKGKRAAYHTKKNKAGYWTENRYKDNVIRQILAEGVDPIINYVFWHSDEKVAYDYEEVLIEQYGRRRYDKDGILTNLCKDARPPHPEFSNERREKYRQMMLGNTINKNRVQSEEEKEKRTKSLLEAYRSGKRIVSDSMREIMSKTHKDKIVTEKTRLKMSESATIAKAWRRGKTNEEIFGIEKAAEIKAKKSKLLPPNRKPITINGVTYQSIRAAAIALNTTEYKVQKFSDTK